MGKAELKKIALKYLRQLYLKVHPDYFSTSSKEKRVNSDNLIVLNQLFQWAKTSCPTNQITKRSESLEFYWKRPGTGLERAVVKIDGGSKGASTAQLLELCERLKIRVDNEDLDLIEKECGSDFKSVASWNPFVESREKFATAYHRNSHLEGDSPAVPEFPWSGGIYHRSLSQEQKQIFQNSFRKLYREKLYGVIPRKVFAHRKGLVLYVTLEYDWSLKLLRQDGLLTVPWNFASSESRKVSDLRLLGTYFELVSKAL